jgi:cytochrome c553
MKRLRPIVIGAAGAVLGLFLLLLSGVLNFAASSGHWDITDWVMDLAARQSVTLRSLGIEAPPLDDPDMIRRGAGHYELVCAACHGSPAQQPEEFAAHLTPRPPLLVEQMQHWRPPARIFWTVKHGIKRTAMPAWPTQLRDDEIWDVVAFIESMPKLTAAQYRDLASDRDGNICTNCHGEDGGGRDAFPRLDIQSPEYLAAALRAFRDGTRTSGVMAAAAHGLGDAQIDELANAFGRSISEATDGSPEGQRVALQGLPDRDVPPCESCHGDTARPDFPRLTGQSVDYLRRQLNLFLTIGAKRGGAHADIMARAVHNLSPDEAAAVADWYGN